jgi:1-acyl-sn-glycerol-3-phosphate acyltransferase
MYLLVKLLANFAIWLTCKRFSVYNKAVTQTETPLVLGCHHPNSFLDAILVGAIMKKPVHFLTRSDVFNNPVAVAIMQSVNMIPIYRIRDGKDNLSRNDVTFELCRKYIQQGQHVLIFVEGFCNYQTTLQLPLKKGAPRLLLQGWKDGVDVQLLPVWLRYSSFNGFPKEIDINFGKPFGREAVAQGDENGAAMFSINRETERQLQELSPIRNNETTGSNNFLLFLPAMLGMLTHIALYYPLTLLANRLRGEIHYDSVLFCLIAFLYPVYILLIAGIVYFFTGFWWAVAAIIGLPLLGKSYVLWK